MGALRHLRGLGGTPGSQVGMHLGGLGSWGDWVSWGAWGFTRVRGWWAGGLGCTKGFVRYQGLEGLSGLRVDLRSQNKAKRL